MENGNKNTLPVESFIDILHETELITDEEKRFIYANIEEMRTNAAATGFDFLFHGCMNDLAAEFYFRAPSGSIGGEPGETGSRRIYGDAQKEILNEKIEKLRQTIRKDHSASDVGERIKFIVLWKTMDSTSWYAIHDLIDGQNDLEICYKKPDRWDKSKIFVVFTNYFDFRKR